MHSFFCKNRSNRTCAGNGGDDGGGHAYRQVDRREGRWTSVKAGGLSHIGVIVIVTAEMSKGNYYGEPCCG